MSLPCLVLDDSGSSLATGDDAVVSSALAALLAEPNPAGGPAMSPSRPFPSALSELMAEVSSPVSANPLFFWFGIFFYISLVFRVHPCCCQCDCSHRLRAAVDKSSRYNRNKMRPGSCWTSGAGTVRPCPGPRCPTGAAPLTMATPRRWPPRACGSPQSARAARHRPRPCLLG
jgi:hypothetical protein